MNEHKLNEMISTSLGQIREIAGADTVTGSPIQTNNGTVIIPVSKISMGYASGGVDYAPKSSSGKDGASSPKSSQTAFGGGGGTGISITPLCFLVVKANGDVEMLNIVDNKNVPAAASVVDSIAGLLEKSPEIISKLKTSFSKPASVSDMDDEATEAADAQAVEEEIARTTAKAAKAAALRAKAAKADAKAASYDAKAAKADAKAADLEMKAEKEEQ